MEKDSLSKILFFPPLENKRSYLQSLPEYFTSFASERSDFVYGKVIEFQGETSRCLLHLGVPKSIVDPTEMFLQGV